MTASTRMYIGNRQQVLLLSGVGVALLFGCLATAGFSVMHPPGYPGANLANFPSVEFAQTSYCPGTQGATGASPTLNIGGQYISPDDVEQVEKRYVQEGWTFTGLKGTIVYIPPNPPTVFKTPWFTLTKGEKVSLHYKEGQSGTRINAHIFVFACSSSRP